MENRPIWELSFVVYGEQAEVESLFHECQDVLCDCYDKDEDYPCRNPTASIRPLESPEEAPLARRKDARQ